eukprot:6068179-Pleurochrysis_carterae.AAC.1
MNPYPTPDATSPSPAYTYMWCEGEAVSVADGTSDKKSESPRTLLPAGALPEDAERDEAESFT